MRLAGKIAIITGAAGGMGEASALLFAREGAKIAAVDLNEARVAPVVDAIRAAGGTAIAIGADISKTGDVQRIVDRTVAEIGLPNILFNNAGVDTENKRSILDISEEAFDRCVEVNLKGVWLMTKHVAPRMIEAGGGSIVNTASIAASIVASSAGYCASKAGVVALTKVTAVELGKHGIRVNVICPGAIETEIGDNTQQRHTEAAEVPAEYPAGEIPLTGERPGRAKDIAELVLFLSSNRSRHISGSPVWIDGAQSLLV